MRVMGIDPGLKGGIAIIEDGKLLGNVVMPVADDELDLDGICEIMAGEDYVFLEKGIAMPGQDVKSIATTFRNIGILECMAWSVGANLIMVHPRTWGCAMLTKEERKANKKPSVLYVQEKFPEVNLLPTKRCRKAHDGMADAICIALYGYQILLSQGQSK